MSRCLCNWVRRWLLFGVTWLGAGLALAQTSTTQSWVLTGRVETLEGTVPLPLAVGDPLRVVVTFDPAASFSIRASSDGRPGFRFEYGNHTALQLAIYGGGCNPCRPLSTAAKNGIYVRDSYADPGRNPAPDVPYDGISFFMDPSAANDDFGYSVILRDVADQFTPQVIAVTGNRPIPTTPDSRLAQMATRVLQVFNDDAVLSATLDSVAVQPTRRPVTFDPADGRLRIPFLRVGQTGYQNIELALIDPARLRFRVVAGTPIVPPAPADAAFDVGLGQLSLPSMTAGTQQYRSVNLVLDDPAGLGFAVTGELVVDPALTETRWPVNGLASFAGRGVRAGSVTARCADGHQTRFELANDGSFAGELVTERSSPFPCLFRVEVEQGLALYSLVETHERTIHLSLLSTFTLAKSLKGDPGVVYAEWGTAHTFWPGSGLTDAPQFVVSAL